MRADLWVKRAADALASAGVLSPTLDAQVLAAHALGQSRSWLLAHPEADVPGLADLWLQRRLAREPLAYIIGVREFYGRVFRVSPNVLVPRQETETVVELALSQAGGRVLDVGTGSGCIGVTLSLERPTWQVTGVDIDPLALGQARANAAALGADVRFLVSDLTDAVSAERFDLIVSNPPYVAAGSALMPEVAHYEPSLALYGGPDGLQVYERLSLEAPTCLREGGVMVVEIGDAMQDQVTGLFLRAGWTAVGSRSDLSGAVRGLAFGWNHQG